MPSSLAVSGARDVVHDLIDDRYPDYCIFVFQYFDQELIMSYAHDQAIAKRSEEKIAEIYWQLIRDKKRLPWFSEVCSEVINWNQGVFYQAAIIEQEFNPDNRFADLEDLAADWALEIDGDLTSEIERYVCDALSAFELAFLVSYEDEMFWQEDMVRVRMRQLEGFTVNDAQNILLPEIASFQQIGYGSWINIYPNKTSTLMLLEGENR